MKAKAMRITTIIVALCISSIALYSCGKASTWKEARQADTYQAYQAYIEDHPEGEHVAEARKLADQRYWDAIKNDTTAKTFQTYLDQFSNGKYRAEAQTKLSQLSSGGTLAAKGRVTGSSVIIRSDHTTESPSAGVVAKEGTIVQILDRYSAGNSNEALLKRNVTVVKNGNRINLSQGKAVQVISDLNDSVHVSFSTARDGSVEATISKNNIEAMSGQTWYKIHTRDDITGWIYGKFIKEL